jgi:hypothetical protein
MLDVPVVNSSYDAFRQASGTRTGPIHRWRNRLSPAEISVIQAVGGRPMRTLGYERVAVDASVIDVATAWATLPLSLWRAGMANRDRMGNVPAYVWRRLRFAVDRDGWLSGGRAA